MHNMEPLDLVLLKISVENSRGRSEKEVLPRPSARNMPGFLWRSVDTLDYGKSLFLEKYYQVQ